MERLKIYFSILFAWEDVHRQGERKCKCEKIFDLFACIVLLLEIAGWKNTSIELCRSVRKGAYV